MDNGTAWNCDFESISIETSFQKKLVSMVIDDALAFGKPWVRMRRISSLVRALRFLA